MSLCHGPRRPLATRLASQNRVLGEGVGQNTTPYALRALLRYDFSLRSESIGCSRAPSPLRRGPPPRRLAEPFFAALVRSYESNNSGKD